MVKICSQFLTRRGQKPYPLMLCAYIAYTRKTPTPTPFSSFIPQIGSGGNASPTTNKFESAHKADNIPHYNSSSYKQLRLQCM